MDRDQLIVMANAAILLLLSTPVVLAYALGASESVCETCCNEGATWVWDDVQ